MPSRTLSDWFAEYGESHQHPTNEIIHFICVPTIFFTVAGLLWSIPIPDFMSAVPALNWASLSLLLVVAFYARLSRNIAIGMALFSLLCLGLLYLLEARGISILWLSIVIFVLAWIGQFVGHHIEGKKPSFFKDLQFLLIGPAWVMGFLYRKLGIAC